ncbi:Xaa-Pro dipeptidyl-peptidase [Pendulispora albinea]|uniref:Xaa-Pro dipeptidyl-peptidase n=1 Tax=Pendulispora albinea TaxID=2741071 RepID=A0ABZ2LJN8_9BACT
MVHPKMQSSVARSAVLTSIGCLLFACSVPTEDEDATSAAAQALDGESTPIYSYANAIRESVWVTTSLDNDGDGKPDKVAVDIVRPREAVSAGVKVPVILEASPYYKSPGRGNESQIKAYDSSGVISKVPLFYDNYFVPRGYAFVAVDLAGTNRSTGCLDVGGQEEIQSAKAVIDWLNGRATATRADGTAVRADWTTGKVGMIGKSWDGTIANGVAATGVDGLVTIVPIAAISSWYVYTRAEGVLRGRNRVRGLAAQIGNRPTAACQTQFDALGRGQDDTTGNYNAFFAERDYLPAIDKVRASVFVVHGLDDWNVTTPQYSVWWNALGARNVPRKIWLYKEAHVDPFDIRRAEWVDTLHKWFDHWLQGRSNGIMDGPIASVERKPNTWKDEPSWPPPGTHTESLTLGIGNGTTGTLSDIPSLSELVAPTRTFTDNTSLTESAAVSNPNTSKGGRLVFLSKPLAKDIRISGTSRAVLRVRVNKPTTSLTARLVDYGRESRNINYRASQGGIVNLTTRSCWGESTSADSACFLDTALDLQTTDFGVLSRGSMDAAHRDSLTRPSNLNPNTWYDLDVPLDASDDTLVAGHVLGLVLTATDPELTSPLTTGATIDVDLGASRLELPLVDPPTALADSAARSRAGRTVAADLATDRPPQVHAPQPPESGVEPAGTSLLDSTFY